MDIPATLHRTIRGPEGTPPTAASAKLARHSIGPLAWLCLGGIQESVGSEVNVLLHPKKNKNMKFSSKFLRSALRPLPSLFSALHWLQKRPLRLQRLNVLKVTAENNLTLLLCLTCLLFIFSGKKKLLLLNQKASINSQRTCTGDSNAWKQARSY